MDIFFQDYNIDNAKQWLIDHEAFLLKCVGAYIISIFSIKFVMRTLKPFDLQVKFYLNYPSAKFILSFAF